MRFRLIRGLSLAQGTLARIIFFIKSEFVYQFPISLVAL